MKTTKTNMTALMVRDLAFRVMAWAMIAALSLATLGGVLVAMRIMGF